MTVDPKPHGAYTSPETMLSTIQDLTVVVAENNVKLEGILSESRENKRMYEAMRAEIGALKVKVYTTAASLSLILSLLTPFLKDKLSQ